VLTLNKNNNNNSKIRIVPGSPRIPVFNLAYHAEGKLLWFVHL